MQDPDMLGSVSIVSNDTGAYSPVRLTKKDDKPTVRHFQICTLLSLAQRRIGKPGVDRVSRIPGLEARYNSDYSSGTCF